MTYDFRALQLQTNKILASGSTGTNASLLIYSASADTSPYNQGNIDPTKFDTSGIGTDVFVYVSGSDDNRTVFGGTVYVSGTFVVSESCDIKGTGIVFDNPTVVGNVAAPSFNRVGIGLGGFDPDVGYSGSVYIPSAAGMWMPIIRHETDYQYGTTTFYIGSSFFNTTFSSNELNVQSNTATNFAVGSGYSIRLAVHTGDAIVLGSGDNGTISPPYEPNTPLIRSPNIAGLAGVVDTSGVDMQFQSGLGTGASVGSGFTFSCPEPTTTGDAQQTPQTRFKLHGNGCFQMYGYALANRPDASGGSLAGSLWYSTNNGIFSVASGSTWVDLITSAMTSSFGGGGGSTDTTTYDFSNSTGITVEAGSIAGNYAKITNFAVGGQLVVTGSIRSDYTSDLGQLAKAYVPLISTNGRNLRRFRVRANLVQITEDDGANNGYADVCAYMILYANNNGPRAWWKIGENGFGQRNSSGGGLGGVFGLPIDGTLWVELEYSDGVILWRYGTSGTPHVEPTSWTDSGAVANLSNGLPIAWSRVYLAGANELYLNAGFKAVWDDLTIEDLD